MLGLGISLSLGAASSPPLYTLPSGDAYMFAGTRNMLPSGRQTVNAGQEYGSGVMGATRVPSYQINSPRFIVAGIQFYNANSTDSANGVTEHPLGNDWNLTELRVEWTNAANQVQRTVVTAVPYTIVNGVAVAGAASIVVPNAGLLVTDANAAIQPKPGTTMKLLWKDVMVAGQFRPLSGAPTCNTLGDASYRGASDTTILANGVTAFAESLNGTQILGGCMGVVAKGWKAAYDSWVSGGSNPASFPGVDLVWGDSLSQVGNETWGNFLNATIPDGVCGFASRGLADASTSTQHMVANWGISGTRYASMDRAATKGEFKLAVLELLGHPYTAAVVEMGTNTLNNLPGSLTTQAEKDAFMVSQAQSAWAYARIGRRMVIQTTILPSPFQVDAANGTSSYFYTDPAQYVGSHATRGNFNEWIKATPYPLRRYIDAAAALQTQTGSVNEFLAISWSATLATSGITAGSANPQTINIDVGANATPQAGWTVVLEPGVSGKAEWQIIKSVGAPTGSVYPCVLSAASSFGGKATCAIAHSVGAALKQTYAFDGLHLTLQGAVAAAATMGTAKNAGAFAP